MSAKGFGTQAHLPLSRGGPDSSRFTPAMTKSLKLLTKKEKTGFFLLRGKQAKINALISPIFYCVSSILSATGWGLSAVSPPCLPTARYGGRDCRQTPAHAASARKIK
jgi:hypothetical protein